MAHYYKVQNSHKMYIKKVEEWQFITQQQAAHARRVVCEYISTALPYQACCVDTRESWSLLEGTSGG